MYRCPACRTRRASLLVLLQHMATHEHAACTCGGYHYPHRPGSPCCELNPMVTLHRALRTGGATDQELDDLEMDAVWHGSGKPMTNWRD